jgi:hypothetical protein
MTPQDKPLPATKLDILINLRNAILERLTYAQIDFIYHPKYLRMLPTKSKDQFVIADRQDSEHKLKKSKRVIEQDTLLLEVVDKMIAEQTDKEEASLDEQT